MLILWVSVNWSCTLYMYSTSRDDEALLRRHRSIVGLVPGDDRHKVADEVGHHWLGSVLSWLSLHSEDVGESASHMWIDGHLVHLSPLSILVDNTGELHLFFLGGVLYLFHFLGYVGVILRDPLLLGWGVQSVVLAREKDSLILVLLYLFIVVWKAGADNDGVHRQDEEKEGDSQRHQVRQDRLPGDPIWGQVRPRHASKTIDYSPEE